MLAYILNIVLFVVALVFAAYGTLYTSGYLDKKLMEKGYPLLPTPSRWALFNTFCYWIIAFVLFLLLFI